MKDYFANIKVSNKLILILALPLLGLIFFAIYGINEKYRVLSEMEKIKSLSEVSVKTSALIHQLQKERGLSAGFLGSKGASFREELQTQRSETDEGLKTLTAFLDSLDTNILTQESSAAIDDALANIKMIGSNRNSIDTFNMSIEEEIQYFTKIIDSLLESMSYLQQTIVNAELATRMSSILSLIKAKEKAGLERGLLNGVFAADRMPTGMANELNSVISQQDVFLSDFLSKTTDQGRKLYADKMKDQLVEETLKMRELATGRDEKIELISNLEIALGYGGLIHRFKNYVLRGSPIYLETFNEHFENANNALDDYRKLANVTPIEIKNIEIIQNTIDQYKDAIAIAADLKAKGMSIAEIDSRIVINDAPAIDALNNLITKGNFGVESDQWWELQSSKINLLRDMENTLSHGLIIKANNVRNEALSSLFLFIGLTIIVVVVALALAYFVSRSIVSPLHYTVGMANRLALGDTGIKFSNGRKDELGLLLHSIERTTKSINELASAADKIAEGNLTIEIAPRSENDTLGNALSSMLQSLRRQSEEIVNTVHILASSSGEIASTTSQLTASAQELSSSVHETQTTLEEVKHTAHSSSKIATVVSENARITLESSNAGETAVNNTIAKMNDIRTQMGFIAESIVRLNEQTQAIGDIASSVADLADQSNILAVNASIEAAKAGEHGKGFAVVAQEIRNLAEQSKGAMEQVRNILNNIQKATRAAVITTEEGSKAVDIGIEQSKEAGVSIKSLAKNIHETAQASLQIAASSKEQIVGVEQVSYAIENVAQASNQNVVVAQQLETLTASLEALGDRLNTLVQRYKLKP